MRHHPGDGIVRGQHPTAEQREQARALRRHATAPERAAWTILRGRGLLNLKFRRQQVIAGFIVDFYCAEHRLAIAIDGPVDEGPERQAYDTERDGVLRDHGIEVVRVPADDVSRARLEGLLRKVLPLFRRERGQGVRSIG